MGQPKAQQTEEVTDPINSETDKFSFEHVAGYGLIPKVTHDCIKKCGVRKAESTRRIIIQAWKELRYQVKEKIWKYRNERTIEFELACGITEKAKNKRKEKTTKKVGPRNKTETKEGRTTKNTTICQLCEGTMNSTGNHECSGRVGRIKKAIKILIEDRKGTKKIQPGWTTTSSKYMSAYAKNEEFEYQPKRNQESRKGTEANENQLPKEKINTDDREKEQKQQKLKRKLEELEEYEDRVFKDLRKGRITLEGVREGMEMERKRLEIPEDDENEETTAAQEGMNPWAGASRT
ncbi:hypothetical protein BDR26DRAFT_944191 [Obelidium mucronatum]|nr:hypothetical protein BDR26DRAFT_944191 [Obelidium mucronatum]